MTQAAELLVKPVVAEDASFSLSVRPCGVTTLLAWILLAPLTFGIAVVTPFDSRTPEEIAVLQGVIDHIPLLGPNHIEPLKSYLAGDSLLQSRWACCVAYMLPLCVATACALIVLGRVTRRHILVTDRDVGRLLYFAMAFAVVNVLLYPMFTQDFWYSVAWGRMLAAGDNPYYTYFTPDAVAGLPLYYDKSYMTYGPLWGWISALVALLGGHVVVLEYVLFKLLLLGAWVACLSVVKRLTADRSPRDQAVAVILFGWMPMSYFLTVAEGHNDIFMVLPMMLWLYLISHGRHLLSPWALAVSVLIKYITLPLVLVELWCGWSAMRGRRAAYAATLAGCFAAAVLCVVSLARDLEFIRAARQMQNWHMLTPAMALVHLATWLQLPIPGSLFSGTVLLALATLTGYYAWSALQQPGFDQFLLAIVAGLLLILLVVVGHVWPWFVLWVLAPAVVTRRSLAKDLAIALALAAPFVHVYWIWGHEWVDLKYATVLYFAVVAGLLVAARYSRRRPDTAGVRCVE